MAIDITKIHWATTMVVENVTYVDPDTGEETDISVSNKIEPPAQFKDTGALFEENIPRAYINYMFDEIRKAIEDHENRITALEP